LNAGQEQLNFNQHQKPEKTQTLSEFRPEILEELKAQMEHYKPSLQDVYADPQYQEIKQNMGKEFDAK